jgi:hypothetical protein
MKYATNEKAVMWSIRAMYCLTVADTALASFNVDGDDLGLFLSQVILHFLFLLCAVVSITSAVAHAFTSRMKLRMAVCLTISIIKFGLLFFFFFPYNAFFVNFIFYAALIDLSFSCLSP